MPEPGRTARNGVACALLLGALCAAPAWGQQVNLTRYATAAGLPAVRVTAVLQDHQGFLWFGTSGGLARYDGAAFRVLGREDGLGGDSVLDLEQGRDDLLYVATRDGGTSVVGPDGIRPLEGLGPDDLVLAIESDGSGRLWLAGPALVAEIGEAGTATRLSVSDWPDGCCTVAYRDRQGRTWVGTDRGLMRWQGDALVRVGAGLPRDATIHALAEDATGSLWVGTGRGLYRETAGRFRVVQTALGRGVTVLSAAPSGDGGLWFGTDRGAVHVRGAPVQVTTASGMPDGAVHDVEVDHEGNVWFATEAGAAKLVASNFATFSRPHGLPGSSVVALAAGPDTSIWVATREGLARIVDGQPQPLTPSAPAGSPVLTALSWSSPSRLLVGTSEGLYEWSPRTGEFRGPDADLGPRRVTALLGHQGQRWVGTEAGLWSDAGGEALALHTDPAIRGAHVTALAGDGAGRVWLGTLDAGLYREEAGVLTPMPLERRVAIWSVAPSDEGGVWVATNGLGAVRIRADGSSVSLTRAGNGLASDFVQQVLGDRSGQLWIYTSRGLDRWHPGQGVTHFDVGSGLADMSGSPGAAAVDADGRLWFGTPSGLTVYRPGPTPIKNVAPEVVIHAVTIDGQPATSEQLVSMASSRNEVTFYFTALSFRQESGPRFQYRLRGRTESWSRPTEERRVSFVDLPPGDFVFEVQAINGQGLWSQTPASLQLRVRPAPWQTRWFQGGVAIVGLLLIAGLIRRQFRKVDAERRTLRVLVDQRTRELVEKNTQLERMATTDELTALPNRRFFLESMERELRKMTRLSTDQPLSLLVLDLDRFKSINDQHGHQAGDEVLRQVSRRLAQGVRATDLPARYGGEEFAILLPNTGPDGARFLAEKLRGEVEAMQVSHGGKKIPVTISLGVATVDGGTRYDPAVEENLLRRADEAMYRAKESGRNRVEVAK